MCDVTHLFLEMYAQHMLNRSFFRSIVLTSSFDAAEVNVTILDDVINEGRRFVWVGVLSVRGWRGARKDGAIHRNLALL